MKMNYIFAWFWGKGREQSSSMWTGLASRYARGWWTGQTIRLSMGGTCGELWQPTKKYLLLKRYNSQNMILSLIIIYYIMYIIIIIDRPNMQLMKIISAIISLHFQIVMKISVPCVVVKNQNLFVLQLNCALTVILQFEIISLLTRWFIGVSPLVPWLQNPGNKLRTLQRKLESSTKKCRLS